VVELVPGSILSYQFEEGQLKHNFCSVCGVSTHIHIAGPSAIAVGGMSDEERETSRRKLQSIPINLSLFNGIDWEIATKKVG
jgi:hypothetical protein